MLQNDREVQDARTRINQQGLRHKVQSQKPVSARHTSDSRMVRRVLVGQLLCRLSSANCTRASQESIADDAGCNNSRGKHFTTSLLKSKGDWRKGRGRKKWSEQERASRHGYFHDAVPKFRLASQQSIPRSSMKDTSLMSLYGPMSKGATYSFLPYWLARLSAFHQASITALIVMLDNLLLLRASSEFENTAPFEKRTTNSRPRISPDQRCLS